MAAAPTFFEDAFLNKALTMAESHLFYSEDQKKNIISYLDSLRTDFLSLENKSATQKAHWIVERLNRDKTSTAPLSRNEVNELRSLLSLLQNVCIEDACSRLDSTKIGSLKQELVTLENVFGSIPAKKLTFSEVETSKTPNKSAKSGTCVTS